MLLSVGANDINFSGLVADVIVDNATERALFRRSGVMASVDDARSALTRDLPQGFAKLREALKPLVGGDLSRVVYVSYANPTLAEAARPAPAAAPASTFIPRSTPIRSGSPRVVELRRERIPAAAEGAGAVPGRHPVPQSARRPHDLRRRASGGLRQSRLLRARRKRSRIRPAVLSRPTATASIPISSRPPASRWLCGRSASEYRAYLPRARWIRDANDSYFAAMTYPQGLPTSQQPADIHDATWGVLSAVYGGAVHPTAEGHAAMADAALPAAAAVLQLDAAVPEVTSQPMAPPRFAGSAASARPAELTTTVVPANAGTL